MPKKSITRDFKTAGSRRRFVNALFRAQLALDGAITLALRPLGITRNQLMALEFIGGTPGLTGAALARFMGLTPQSTGALLTQLEAAGWVIRSPKPGNRRAIGSGLTDQGRMVLGTGQGSLSRIYGLATEHLPKPRRLAAAKALEACAASLGQSSRADREGAPPAD